ncbi:type IV pilin N-terminal domain-containing protein [Natronorubrum sp. DTA28]|uniref:type IV pilin N-terminal domain-containing protein n=1 Tax=Natronorubrum sp. DTA28 TaxID=3447019 RepID=UPI003F845678
MTSFSRRTVVATGCALSGLLAGCLGDVTGPSDGSDDESTDDDSEANDGESGPLADAVTTDGEVDYPAFVDDDVTVDEDAGRLEYAEPDVEFVLEAIVEDQVPTDDELRIGRDLSSETMAAFIAPAFDDDEFTYHVFANATFVEYADWYAAFSDGNSVVDGRHVSFDELQHGVSHLSLTPPDAATVTGIVDGDFEAPEADDAETTGVAIAKHQPETTPQATFEVDSGSTDDRTVTVVHTSGDDLETAHLAIVVDGERIEDPFESDTVGVGERVRIEDVPDDAEFEIRYDDGSDDVQLFSTTIVR